MKASEAQDQATDDDKSQDQTMIEIQSAHDDECNNESNYLDVLKNLHSAILGSLGVQLTCHCHMSTL